MAHADFRIRISVEPDVDDVQKTTVSDEPSPDTAACNVFKSVDESRVTVALAYPHSRADKSVAADGHIDFAGKSAVEKACWAFTANSRSVGLMHQDGTEGHGTVVESGLHHGPDWVIKGDDGIEKTTIMDGDWVMAVQWDEPTWALIKSKRLNGLSPQGSARRGTPTPEALANLRSN